MPAAAGQQEGRAAQHCSQLFGQGLSREYGPRLPADVPALVQEKRLQVFESQRRAQSGVVAQTRMRVQRQVRAINSQIILDQQFEHLPAHSGPWNGRTPE